MGMEHKGKISQRFRHGFLRKMPIAARSYFIGPSDYGKDFIIEIRIVRKKGKLLNRVQPENPKLFPIFVGAQGAVPENPGCPGRRLTVISRRTH
jgi:hypothetical protein